MRYYTVVKDAYPFFIRDNYQTNNVLFIAADDEEASSVYYNLKELLPKREILFLPAVDTIYYDTVSPSKPIMAEIIKTLTLLACAKKVFVVTSLKAAMKLYAPKDFFIGNSLTIRTNMEISRKLLVSFLEKSGFYHVDQVYDKGEYAVRGDIIDIFPIDSLFPLRIDFFDDVVERIRLFDATTQTSTEKIDTYSFLPIAEFAMDDGAVSAFRTKYREHFGIAGNDPLYESVSAKRLFPGIENYLPLFYDNLAPLFAFLPRNTKIITFDGYEQSIDDMVNGINDNYQARIADNPVTCRPEELYIDADILKSKVTDVLSDFTYDGSATLYTAGMNFSASRADKNRDVFIDVIDYVKKNDNVVITAFSVGSAERLHNILLEKGIDVPFFPSFNRIKSFPAVTVMDVSCGFKHPDLNLITEQDILGERLQRVSHIKKQGKFIKDVSSLEIGDIVVHLLHGIGRYDGLETLQIGNSVHECLKIIYFGNDKLYVPVENINILSKYGTDSDSVVLDKLGSTAWQARKASLKKKILEIAEGLIKIAAVRRLKNGNAITVEHGTYDEFCSLFPYVETADQHAAINDVVNDLSSGHPMDRLICGDVGFGKTEVALRAAFIAVSAGYQVAVIVPTTLLAKQHYETFCTRLKHFPVRIRQLSRLVSAKDASATCAEAANGKADIVIGTHALLSNKVKFKNLALLIIDEEQHFGVKHKEKIKEMKADVHVLTLSATPIPRTLQMSLSGIKELSIIATPPIDRQAVATFITPFDKVAVRSAIMKEFNRGGQVFYVCPKIADMPLLLEKLHEIVPEVKIVAAHGQMSASQIEKNVMAFRDRQYDVLLSTSIIESGIDMPLVNTLIVHRSDMFGLAALYQLRGRVGRGKIKGYAYFTVEKGKKLSKTAMKRLNVIKSLDTLGAGFTLASRDMDIRGAGNILGDEQSGFIKEVGVELYQKMLEEAIAKLKEEELNDGEKRENNDAEYVPSLNLGISILIPDTYIADLGIKLEFYHRIAAASTRMEIDALIAEMIDRFGPIPAEVKNLFAIVELKLLCKRANIEKVDVGEYGVLISFYKNQFANPLGLISLLNKSDAIKLRPDQKIIICHKITDSREIIPLARRVLSEFDRIANDKTVTD